MRTVLVSILAFSLSGAPAFAQSMQHLLAAPVQPLRESARIEGAKLAALESMQDPGYMPGGMRPGYFWTSIGLAAAGAGWLAVGAAVGAGCDDYDDEYYDDVDCEGLGKGVAIFGGGLVATGLLLWIIGKSTARAAGNPQLLWTPRGIGLRSQVSF